MNTNALKSLLASVVLVGIVVCFSASCSGRVSQAQRKDDSGLTAHFCDLIRNPAQYEGKKVFVRASLRAHFEYTEMFCLSCAGMGATWPEFAGEDDWEGSDRVLRRIPKAGIVNATFGGTFESSQGAYGHMGIYRFRFRIASMRDMSVVYRGAVPPQSLPVELQAKMCH